MGEKTTVEAQEKDALEEGGLDPLEISRHDFKEAADHVNGLKRGLIDFLSLPKLVFIT